MVLNLKDKEGTISGKGLDWSLFGLLDGEKESKNADVFERIATDMVSTKNASISLKKELSNLTTTGQKLGREIVDAGGGLEKTSQGFLTASKSANKMTLSSKAAALGMKAVSMAANFGVMLAFSLALKGICFIFDTLSVSLEEQQEKISNLNDKYITINKEIKELSDKKLTSPLDNGLTDNENKRLQYLKDYSVELRRVLAIEHENM